jgi:GH43 family beta-xylosidase
MQQDVTMFYIIDDFYYFFSSKYAYCRLSVRRQGSRQAIAWIHYRAHDQQ